MTTFFRKYWRQALFVIVLVISWIAFLFTGMPGEEAPARIFRALYFSGALFILGALDVGFPHSGPLPALVVLWICYFIAPAFTLSYAYTIIEQKVLNKLPIYVKNHNVILGLGRNGLFIYEMLKNRFPHEKIVIADRNSGNPNLSLYERDSTVWWFRNDFEDKKTFLRARIKKAKRVFITTNDDLTNLSAMVECRKINPGLDIYCHLQNYVMHEDFNDSLHEVKGYERIVVFNGYEKAAEKVLELIHNKDDRSNGTGRIFTFMGFGHFGQTLFDDLIGGNILHANDEVIIATLKTKLYFDKMKYSWGNNKTMAKHQFHDPIYKDIFSAELWDDIHELVKNSGKQLIFINCLDNDASNINLAVQLKKNGPKLFSKAIFYCRTFKPISEKLEEILENGIIKGEHKDIVTFSIQLAMAQAYNDLITNSG